jgi:hypothetical protein
VSRFTLLGTTGLLLAMIPGAARAQGTGCTQTQCVAVQHVQVTVRRSMGLAVGRSMSVVSRPATRATAQVRANTAWHLDVAQVPATQLGREGADAAIPVVRYTLVGS